MSEQKLKLEHTYLELPQVLYSIQAPETVPKPELVILNESLREELGIDSALLKSREGVALLSGNQKLEKTIAQAYAGHQYGYFTMLGDGRAVLLGEYITPQGERLDVQLKGSGRTPYSRNGDGKAALGPMLREYMISEAMHALTIPTTRSLAVVTTGEKVLREEVLEGAVLTRLAKSYLRVGTFEYIAKWGTRSELKRLADYTLERHFVREEKAPYLGLLRQVIERQAALIAKWQLVGFIHGVMNTDNMSICGETIDYGPCAFMDHYDSLTVFSSIDHYGRYAYGKQPIIASWNLTRFAETLLPLLDEKVERAAKLAQEAVNQFAISYKKYWLQGMCAKLGLMEPREEDEKLIEALLELMARNQADYTNTFMNLTLRRFDKLSLFKQEAFKKWQQRWENRLKQQKALPDEVQKLMAQHNPRIIPRNYFVEQALEAMTKRKDIKPFTDFLEVLKTPYDYTKEESIYSEVPTLNKCYKTYCGT